LAKSSKYLEEGTPTLEKYWEYVRTSEFKKIEKYSNKFVANTKKLLSQYKNKWVLDSLHQWSRQWEYPYTIKQVLHYSQSKKNLRILDMGSGITFLPFYIEKNLPSSARITCCDYDPTIVSAFNKVAKKLESRLSLDVKDMRELDYPDGSFDLAYSVSVLEHTGSYSEVIKSVHRVLKPGGRMVLTFDISIDGYDDIPIEEACKLLKSIEKYFRKYKAPSKRELINILNSENIVTSSWIAKTDRKLMPWAIPVINPIKTLIKYRKVGRLYKSLTFYCLTVEK